MSRFRVRASGPLSGRVQPSGATKNAGLKQMAAALLAPGITTLRNVPTVRDLDVMIELLRATGAKVDQPAPDVVRVDASGELTPEAPYELVARMRASFNVLGPLLARCGQARVALPGGDNIGSRKVDMHLRGLEAMGAQVDVDHGFVHARCDALQGARVLLEFPSVGATENLMCAAVLAKGTTVIENAAREPEVTALATFLNRMGAHILGAGSSTIEIEGVAELTPVEHTVIPDRIEAATFLAVVGVAGGEITLLGARADHMDMLIQKLGTMGMRISPTPEGIWAMSKGELRSTDISTLPYPGVATDYKPLLVAMLTVAEGIGIVTENIFGGRFRYISELVRMGADIRTEGHHAVVRGIPALSGAPVRASDIRAGAALVIAGIRAEGETLISGAGHLDRGYERFDEKLRDIGVDVTRLP